MRTDYRVDLLTKAGQKVAEFTTQGDWSIISLVYQKRLREPGLGSVVLHGLNPELSKWLHRGQVEVWRRCLDVGLDWYCDFRGLFLSKKLEKTSRDLATLTFPGQMWLLGTRVVAWHANTSNRSKFLSAKPETIAKTLVEYNAGASATVVNGRIKVGTITGISNAGDLARGTNTDYYCAFDNLLVTLQRLALMNGFDFDLVKTGPQAWQFEYYPSLGVDRTATLTFSLERDNMTNPVYTLDRSQEVTAVLVGGKGEDAARNVQVATSADYTSEDDLEAFTSYTEADTNAALVAFGDKKLQELQKVEIFQQTPRQTATDFYGKAYCVDGVLGDTAGANFRGIQTTQRIVGVNVSVSGGVDSVEVETQTII